ncbi:SCO family protein [Halalkalibacter oceani]|uniref:SCO family protein n=1 Tax=Halalkalibacter oceani TaxID=1653776 RepID=UPI0033995B01
MKRLLLFVGLVVVLSGCGWMYELGGGGSSDFDIAEAGLAVPEFNFVDQDGEPYGTEQLTGQYWLANLIFTHCPSVCPTMTPNMRNLQTAMQEEGIEMGYISFTVDPERDTPELLKSYATNVGANGETWKFLTGYEVEEITELSMTAFASPVQPLDDGDIGHTTAFFLIDPEGNVIRKYDGLQTDQEPIIDDLMDTVQYE